MRPIPTTIDLLSTRYIIVDVIDVFCASFVFSVSVLFCFLLLCRLASGQVPAFMYSTSHIPEERWGTEYDGIMHVTDWLPTLASGAGVDLHGR